MGFITNAAKRVKELTPKSGYNLCVLDTFGKPDEQELHLISNFESLAEAEAEKARREAENDLDKFFIYGPEEDIDA
jgi:hypothetical protein